MNRHCQRKRFPEMTTIDQQIADTKQHHRDGMITRKEMVRKLLELTATKK
jgi:hypothetical protein